MPAGPPATDGDRRGIAMILTLLTIAIVIVLTVQFAFTVKVEERIVRNAGDDAAMELAARGAIPILAKLFADDRKNGAPNGEPDTLGDIVFDPEASAARTFTLGDVQLELEVEDLERRLPLLWLADSERAELAEVMLRRLLEKLAPVPSLDAAAVAKQIADKIKELQGQAPTPSDGATPAPPPPQPQGQGEKRRGFHSLQQLLDIQDFDRKILYGDPEAEVPTEGIAPYVTTWPVNQININTVLGPVLFAILPEKNKAEASLWEVADTIVEGVRRYRIDPEMAQASAADPDAPAPQPAEGGGGMGASRKWSGTAFAQVDDFQNGSINERLANIFTAAAPGQGQGQPPGGQQPPQQPAPEGSGQGGGAGSGGVEFKTLLTVSSRFYAVRATARRQSAEEEAGEGEEQAPASVYRILVYRNPQDEVSALWMREEPR